MAKNLAQYSDEKKLYDSHAIYMQQLQAWIQSAQGKLGTSLLKSLYTYLDKGTLLHDLVQQDILIVDENGKLSKKRMVDTDGIDIFKLVTEQSSAVLRFIVEDEDGHFHKLWMEADLIKSFSAYYEPCLLYTSAHGYSVMAVAHELATCEDVLDAWSEDKEERLAVLKKFVFDDCKCETNWNMKNFIADQVELIREQVKDKKVLLA